MTTDDPTRNPTDPPEVQPVIGPRLTPAGLRVAAGFLDDSAEGEDADDLRGAAELLRALADEVARALQGEGDLRDELEVADVCVQWLEAEGER